MKFIPNAETIAAFEECYQMLAHPEKYKKYASFKEVVDEVINVEGDSMSWLRDEIRDEVIAKMTTDFARKLLVDGKLTHDEIAEITGLSLDEVSKLASEQ